MPSASQAAVPHSPSQPAERIGVLLLEDVPATALIVRAYVEAANPAASVTTVDTLAGALATLASGDYDLILADLNLPDSRGLQTLQRLRAATDQVTVVLTTEEDEAVRDGAFAAGAYDFLEKKHLSRAVLQRILRFASMQAITFRSLRASNAALERRVAERTAALTEANRELESFTYSVSHDLRAPLRAISSLAMRLREGHGEALPEEGRALVARMEAGAASLGRMLEGLLRFSRVSRLPFAREPVDMDELVRGVLADLRAAGEGGQFEADRLPPVAGDPMLLRLVWQNLIGNAFKFSARSGAPRVRVSAAAGRDWIEYSVRDNGAGFDMRYAAKLFAVFQRLHSQREFEGTGVGLAIAQRIVQRHGGTISAEGSPGEGAVFRFRLPREADAAGRPLLLGVIT